MGLKYKHENLVDVAYATLERVRARYPHQRFKVDFYRELVTDGYGSVWERITRWRILHRVGFFCWREVDLERSLSDQDSQSRVD